MILKRVVSIIVCAMLFISNAYAYEIEYRDIEKYNKYEIASMIKKYCMDENDTIEVIKVPSSSNLDTRKEFLEIHNRIRAAIETVSEYTPSPEYIGLNESEGYIGLLKVNLSYGNISKEEIDKADKLADALAYKIRELYPTNAVKQVAALNYWICNNTTYNIETLGKTGNDAYGVLITGEAVCEGYAKAAGMVLDRLGIPNVLVYTDPAFDESTHVYNLVYIGKWRYLDVTWNDTGGRINEYLLCDKPCDKYKSYNIEMVKALISIKYPELPLPGELEEICKLYGINTSVLSSNLPRIDIILSDRTEQTLRHIEYTDSLMEEDFELSGYTLEEIEDVTYSDLAKSLYYISKDNKALGYWNWAKEKGYLTTENKSDTLTKDKAIEIVENYIKESGVKNKDTKEFNLLSDYRNNVLSGNVVKLGDIVNILYNLTKYI